MGSGGGGVRDGLLCSVAQIVGSVLGFMSGLALLSWVVAYLLNPANPIVGGTSLALAPVVAIFGAFGWVGGAALKADPGLGDELRKMGIGYTAAALFLTIMGLLLPAIELVGEDSGSYYWLAVPYVVLTVLAAGAFGVSTCKLVGNVVRLWQLRDRRAWTFGY